MPSKPLCLLMGISLLLTAGVLSVQADDTSHFQAMSLVRFAEAVEAPAFSLPDPDGKDVALQSFRGKVVLLNFWTTW